MSTVVERGQARCPRCVAVADYVFVEDVYDPAGSTMRYEVRCGRCGERYRERSGAAAPAILEETPIDWPMDRAPAPPRDWRREVRTALVLATQRGRSEIDGVKSQARQVGAHAVNWVRGRRAMRRADQTGG